MDANRGRLITVSDDVLGIKSQIETRWPELEVVFDNLDEVWVVICHGPPEVGDYLAINPPTPYLDERIIKRLERADNRAPGATDPLEEIDKHNAAIERDQERRFEDQIGDFGERFLHALKKDGVRDHCNIESRRPRGLSGNRNGR
jgi:hypothetical protein